MQNLRKIGKYFRSTTLIISIVSILVMGGLWMYNSYSNFYKESNQWKEEYIAIQKDLIEKEVNEVVDEIEYQKSQTEEELKESIRKRTYEAYNIAMSIYKRNKNSKSREEIEEIIKETFLAATYNNGRGYYFGGRIEDNKLLFADRSEFEGREMLDYRSPEGLYIFRDFIDIARSEGEGFYEYMWKHPGHDGNEHRKISFIKLIEPLNIWIGTGEYYKGFQYELQQKVLKRISRINLGRDNYIFVDHFNGVSLAKGDHSQSHLIGKNLWKLEDPNGFKIIQEFRKVIEKNGSGFIQYKWYKPSKKVPVDKITFVKGVSEWNWMVGTGVYLDDINDSISVKRKKLEEDVVKNITSIILIIIILSSLETLFEMHVLKKIKNIIKYEEKVYKTLLKLSMDGIYLGNDRGEILDCNKNIYKMLGYTREEFLNLSLADLVVEDQRKDLSIENDNDTKDRYKEVIFKRKNGTLFPAEINTSSLEIEDEKRQITFLRDITQRKNMENYLKELSIKDDLTHLYNRRHIFKKLKSEVKKSKNIVLPLSISLIDIDYFKKINDKFGHKIGDEVLKKVAKVLQENLRDGDYIGRYGGEEFLIILPNTKLGEASKVIQRTKTIINQLVWEFEELSVSFSGGIIEINAKNSYKNLEEVVDKADKLLYKAKNNGRNRIEI